MTPARFEIGQKHKQESEAGSKASWNTPRSDSRPTMSYPSRMALAFALTSLMTVLVLVGVVSVVWGTVFSDYTRSNIVEIANSAAEKLATSYEENGSWTAGELRTVATSSLVSDDLGMQVVNKKGVIVYDDSWPSASATADVRENQATTDDTSGKRASHSPVSSAPTDSDSVANVEIVTSSGEHVGQVKLWAIGSDALLTKADSAFREKTFNAMALAAVVAVCISVVIGSLVSRMLTKPIHRITSTAKQIRDGDLSARTGLRGDDEIDQLGETFDEMATSLEKDMKHEKRLTSDVAHELRTPLMAMLATVEPCRMAYILPTMSTWRLLLPRRVAWLVWCSRCSTCRAWKTARLRSTLSRWTWFLSCVPSSMPRSACLSTAICACALLTRPKVTTMSSKPILT